MGYLRADDGLLSPEEQRRALGAWTEAKQVELIEVTEDRGTENATPLYEREGFPVALRRVYETGAGILLVAQAACVSPSRLIWAEAAELAHMGGARLVSCAGDAPTGPELDAMRAAFRDFDALSRGVPISVGLRAKKDKLRSRVPPYGFKLADDGQTLIPDLDEEEVIAMATRLRSEGMSLRRIGRALTAAGHSPRRGGEWNPNTLMRLTNRKSG
ncbi:MAG: hypothetical protein H6741_27560 [Alphaproteobacteria bacterium]|nr:hypothetical protein [Alphaproteobacteria bacterium]